jgi:hypothetical protein
MYSGTIIVCQRNELSYKLMDELFRGIVIAIHWTEWEWSFWYVFLPWIVTIYIYYAWNTTRSLFQEHFSLSLDNMVIIGNDVNILHNCSSELPDHSSSMLILRPYHIYFRYKAVFSVNVCHTIIGIHSFLNKSNFWINCYSNSIEFSWSAYFHEYQIQKLEVTSSICATGIYKSLMSIHRGQITVFTRVWDLPYYFQVIIDEIISSPWLYGSWI